MSDDAIYKLTLPQRALVILTIVLGTTIYAGSVLISSALLPQLQGALSATQNALNVVRRGGMIVLVGRTAEDDLLNIQPCHLARKAITIVGSSRYVPAV